MVYIQTDNERNVKRDGRKINIFSTMQNSKIMSRVTRRTLERIYAHASHLTYM